MKVSSLGSRLLVCVIILGLLAACAPLPAAVPAANVVPDELPSMLPTARTSPPATAASLGPTLVPPETPATGEAVDATRVDTTPSAEGAMTLIDESVPFYVRSAARADLAQRLGIDVAQVTLISATRMDLPQGNLGCGQGNVSNEGLIVGSELVFETGGTQYVYHADNRKILPCSPADFPGGFRPTYVTGPDSQPASRPESPAIEALSKRLNIAREGITVVSVEAVEWRDASLGCGQPGRMYAQVITPGHRIVLEADGKVYRYHTGEGRAILCDR